MSDELEAPAPVGHNNPPQTMADILGLKYAEDCKQFDKVIAAAKAAPAVVNDEETQGKVGELVKLIRALKSDLTAKLDTEKAPHQLVLDQVRGFFNYRIDPLEDWRKKLTAIGGEYTERKKKAEARRLQEEADKKKIEQERLMRLASEAELTKSAAAAALVDMQAIRREAEEAKAAAVSEQEIALAELRAADADIAKVRWDATVAAADFAKRAKDGAPASDQEKADKKAEIDAALQKARAKVTAATDTLALAREKAKQAKIDQQKADDAEREKQRAMMAAQRDVDANLKDAVRVGAQAEKLSAKAGSHSPDMGRTKSEHGAVITSAREWSYEVYDSSLLDKDALWPFIHEDAKALALRKWMSNQPPENRKMAGATAEQITVGQVR